MRVGLHMDSLKFSGKLISGLSLGSARVLRLVKIAEGAKDPNDRAAFLAAVQDRSTPILEVLLPPRSFYIIANEFRYGYTHEVLGNDSPFKSMLLPPEVSDIKHERRVSFMIRDALLIDS